MYFFRCQNLAPNKKIIKNSTYVQKQYLCLKKVYCNQTRWYAAVRMPIRVSILVETKAKIQNSDEIVKSIS